MGAEELVCLSYRTHPHITSNRAGGEAVREEVTSSCQAWQLALQAVKDSSTHFPTCKCDLFLDPEKNANWMRREEGGKHQPSSLGQCVYHCGQDACLHWQTQRVHLRVFAVYMSV